VQNDGAALGDFAGDLPAGVYDVIAQRDGETFTFDSGFVVVEGGGCGCRSAGGADVAPFIGLLLVLRRRRR